MRNFTYHNPVRILFGDHALDQLPDLFREFHVSNLLLVCWRFYQRARNLGCCS